MKTPSPTAVFLALLVVTAGISHDYAFLATDVIADLVHYLQWTDVIFVYDRTLSFRCRQDLLVHFADFQVGIIALQLSSSQNDVINPVMKAIKSTTISSVILCIQPNETGSFLQQAKDYDILHQEYQWLIICTRPQMMDLAEILGSDPSNVALVIPDMTSHDYVTDDVIPMAGNYLGGNVTEINTKRSTHQGITPASSFTIYSYDFQTNSFSHVASWTTTSGLEVMNDVIYPTLFQQFNGARLKVVTIEVLPFTKRLPGSENGTVKYDGFCFAILNEMATFLNFSYEVVESPDGLFGGPVNDTWNGMMGKVINGDFHLAVGPITITPERKDVVDFTIPYMEDGGIILTKGGDHGPDLFNVFRPFPWLVWLLISATITIATVILFTIIKLGGWPSVRNAFLLHQQENQQEKQEQEQVQQQQRQQERDKQPKKQLQQQQQDPWTLQECMLVIFASLMNQGVSRHPQSSAARLVLGCWWLFAILVLCIYKASLAALLTVTFQGSNIETIQELAASSLQPVTIAYSSWYTLFKNAHTGVYGTIGARMTGVSDSNDALKLVLEGTAGFVTDINQARYIYGQDCYNLHLASSGFGSNGMGFALPKHAYYREAMNKIILKLQEGGFIETWRKQWWETSSKCVKKEATLNGDKALEVVSIGGVLIAYAFIVSLALTCHLLHWLRLRLPCCKGGVRCWGLRKGQSLSSAGDGGGGGGDGDGNGDCRIVVQGGDGGGGGGGFGGGGRRCVLWHRGRYRFDGVQGCIAGDGAGDRSSMRGVEKR